MKIKCEYCGNFFDDTLEKCPNCGAPNNSIRRSTEDQPTTIEGLKEWYASKGLPPAEVTRFFIGEDYRDPKAFGIYKDEKSGNFVVYKNKADGSRAVRYEGTDEAYAVNELYMRLKQEILEQKAHNLQKASGSDSSGTGASGAGAKRPMSKKTLIIALVVAFVVVVCPCLFIVFSLISGMVIGANTPNEGYYLKDGVTYYRYTESDGGWADYDFTDGDWVETTVSGDLVKWKSAKPYYLGQNYEDGLGVPDFKQSVLYDDLSHEYTQGYYKVEDTDYYFLPSAYGGWYYFDNSSDDWSPVGKSDLPADLQHFNTSQNFWYTPTWDSSTQTKDFESSSYYAEYEDKTTSHSNDSDSSWDSNDTWDSGGTDWDSDW